MAALLVLTILLKKHVWLQSHVLMLHLPRAYEQKFHRDALLLPHDTQIGCKGELWLSPTIIFPAQEDAEVGVVW